MSNSFATPWTCSPPGSFVNGISYLRILEWVAISYSEDLPDLGIKCPSPTLAGGFFTTEPTGRAPKMVAIYNFLNLSVDTFLIYLVLRVHMAQLALCIL